MTVMERKRIYVDKQNFLMDDRYTKDYACLGYIKASLHEHTSTKSSLVNRFEVEVSKYLRVNFNDVIATNSGTSALHLALSTCKFNSKFENKIDVVIMPVMTFIATANAAKYCDYEIEFVDIDRDTWCIDTNKVISKINFYDHQNQNYSAIGVVYVDLYGNISPIVNYTNDKYLDIPRAIVDSSHSFGLPPDKSRLDKADYFCYSFNGNKIITTGAGGLILNGNLGSDYNSYLKSASIQGFENFNCDKIGYNYRMAGINAALGLMQLSYIDYFVERKNRINEIYRDELKDIVEFQKSEPYVKPVWWMTPCLFDESVDIEWMAVELEKYNIETKRIFKPLNQFKYYESNVKYPVAEYIYNHGLCLPSSTLNTDEDIVYVCNRIKQILGERKE